jgi:hypothetical protein
MRRKWERSFRRHQHNRTEGSTRRMHLCTFAISGENAYKITHTGVPKNGASLLSVYCLVQVSVAFLSKTLRQDLRLQGFPYLTRHWTPGAEHNGSASCGALPKNTSLLLRGSRHNGVLPGSESYPQHTLVKLKIPKHTLRRNAAERPGREANHSPVSSADVKNEWSYTTTTPYEFIACTTHFGYGLFVQPVGSNRPTQHVSWRLIIGYSSAHSDLELSDVTVTNRGNRVHNLPYPITAFCCFTSIILPILMSATETSVINRSKHNDPIMHYTDTSGCFQRHSPLPHRELQWQQTATSWSAH